jgi:hypothetical protein
MPPSLLFATDIVRDGQDLGNSNASQILGIVVVGLVVVVVAIVVFSVRTINARDAAIVARDAARDAALAIRDAAIATLQAQRVSDAQASAGHIARVLEDAVGIATLATEAVNRQPGHYQEVTNALEKFEEKSEELRKEIRDMLSLVKYTRRGVT